MRRRLKDFGGLCLTMLISVNSPNINRLHIFGSILAFGRRSSAIAKWQANANIIDMHRLGGKCAVQTHEKMQRDCIGIAWAKGKQRWNCWFVFGHLSAYPIQLNLKSHCRSANSRGSQQQNNAFDAWICAGPFKKNNLFLVYLITCVC